VWNLETLEEYLVDEEGQVIEFSKMSEEAKI
jgi:hypothetical protein